MRESADSENGNVVRRDRRKDKDPRQRLAYDRTYLANERTFASWIRTGISVAAIGIALAQFLYATRRATFMSILIEISFVVSGTAMIAFGAWRFTLVNRELGRGRSGAAAVPPWIIYSLTALLNAILIAMLFLL